MAASMLWRITRDSSTERLQQAQQAPQRAPRKERLSELEPPRLLICPPTLNGQTRSISNQLRRERKVSSESRATSTTEKRESRWQHVRRQL